MLSETVLVLVVESARIEASMTDHFFDHDRLDDYRPSRLVRIVAMLTRKATKFDGVAEPTAA
jgi:hypothetical protein